MDNLYKLMVYNNARKFVLARIFLSTLRQSVLRYIVLSLREAET